MPPPYKIIFDTDPGIDDAMALLLAFSSPEIEVIGLTTVFGNSHVESTTLNALNLLHLAGRADIPVAMGADQPLVVKRGHTGEMVHGDDGMGNIGWYQLSDPAMKAIDKHAAQFIVETIMANPGEITLVPVGPLTNIGLALQLEPRIAQAVRNVVLMGGNVTQIGNISPLAEANIYNDPHAASLVFSAGWDLTMAGLDVTQAVRMDQSFFDALAQSQNKFGQFVARIVPFYQKFHSDRYAYANGSTNTHDPSAIAYLIDPTLFEGARYPVVVPTDGYARGVTIADRREPSAESPNTLDVPETLVLLRADEARFLEMFRRRLTQNS